MDPSFADRKEHGHVTLCVGGSVPGAGQGLEPHAELNHASLDPLVSGPS